MPDPNHFTSLILPPTWLPGKLYWLNSWRRYRTSSAHCSSGFVQWHPVSEGSKWGLLARRDRDNRWLYRLRSELWPGWDGWYQDQRLSRPLESDGMESVRKGKRNLGSSASSPRGEGGGTGEAGRGALQALERIETRLSIAIEAAADELRLVTPTLTGLNLGSFSENCRFTDRLATLLNLLGLRVKCPKCGRPARFVCAVSRGMASGAFFFYHNSTKHGGTASVPPLTLISKAPDGRRRTKKPKKS